MVIRYPCTHLGGSYSLRRKTLFLAVGSGIISKEAATFFPVGQARVSEKNVSGRLEADLFVLFELVEIPYSSDKKLVMKG